MHVFVLGEMENFDEDASLSLLRAHSMGSGMCEVFPLPHLNVHTCIRNQISCGFDRTTEQSCSYICMFCVNLRFYVSVGLNH